MRAGRPKLPLEVDPYPYKITGLLSTDKLPFSHLPVTPIAAMGTDKPPRHVAVALVYSKESHKLLMVSSRAHPGMWICEPFTAIKKTADDSLSSSKSALIPLLIHTHCIVSHSAQRRYRGRRDIRSCSSQRIIRGR